MTKLTYDQIGPIGGSFFESPGNPAPPALRGDRGFMGVANTHGQQADGSVTGGGWAQSFTSTGSITTVIGWDYFEDVGRFVSESNFGIGISGLSKNQGLDGIGVVGAVLLDNASFNGWGGYFDIARSSASAGSATGIEINASQLPNPSPANSGITEFGRMGNTPYKAPVSGQVKVLGLSGGSDASVFGASYAIDAVIDIGRNGAAAWAGINFRFDAIMREGAADDRTSPGNTGYARAISMAHDQGLSWYSRDPSGAVNSGTQEEVFRIYSSIDDADVRMGLSVDNTGMILQEREGTSSNLFRVDYISSAASWPVAIPGAGTLAGFGVRGSGPNNNLGLYPSGTGVLYMPVANLPAYADDAAAASGGLAVGSFYHNTTIDGMRQRRS